jgi:hypothetical protein
MTTYRINKRLFLGLTGAVATAAIVGPARAQDDDPLTPDLTVSPEAAGLAHRNAVFDGLGQIGGLNPVSREGLSALVSSLVENELLSQSDAEFLEEILDWLFSDDPLESLRDMISERIDAASGAIGDLAASLAEILIGSIDVALEMLGEIARSDAAIVIAHDVMGGLQGAAAAAALIKHPAVAIIGAVAGSSAGSFIEVGKRVSGVPNVA